MSVKRRLVTIWQQARDYVRCVTVKINLPDLAQLSSSNKMFGPLSLKQWFTYFNTYFERKKTDPYATLCNKHFTQPSDLFDPKIIRGQNIEEKVGLVQFFFTGFIDSVARQANLIRNDQLNAYGYRFINLVELSFLLTKRKPEEPAHQFISQANKALSTGLVRVRLQQR